MLRLDQIRCPQTGNRRLTAMKALGSYILHTKYR